MSSSSSSVSGPMRLPVNATNGWVILHARDLIDYDSYDVEKWLDGIDDNYDVVDEKYKGMNHGKFPDHDVEMMGVAAAVARHPAGELGEYDPDHIAFSQLSIVERLEAMAVELESGYGGDNGTESSSFVTSPEDLSDTDDASSFSAPSSPSSYYSFLPSDSLEGDSLLSDRSSTNPGSTAGSEISRVDEKHSPASYPSREPLSLPHTAPATAATQAEAAPHVHDLAHKHPRPSSRTLSTSISPSTSPSQFLTVPQARRSRRKLQHQRMRHEIPAPASASASAFTEARPHPLASEILRSPSPVPSLRAEPRAASVPGEMGAPGTPLAFLSTAEAQTKPKPRLRISRNAGRAPRPAPEIVRPQPQRAGTLFVPSPSRTLFAASPFVRCGVAQGEVPLVVVQEEGEEARRFR
ncbi:hypothetical protein F5X98DRAFT_379012 [Xylaria grammica]|nr:hypothetical protein F5X98DRAFT_379012 [Xylaria grammica]